MQGRSIRPCTAHLRVSPLLHVPSNIYSLALGRIKEVLAACLDHEPIDGWRFDGSIYELAEEGFPREAWLATSCGAADRGISASAACLSSLPASALTHICNLSEQRFSHAALLHKSTLAYVWWIELSLVQAGTNAGGY